jgi:hypothetical protein
MVSVGRDFLTQAVNANLWDLNKFSWLIELKPLLGNKNTSKGVKMTSILYQSQILIFELKSI